jgi:hypothetical protein
MILSVTILDVIMLNIVAPPGIILGQVLAEQTNIKLG